MDDKKRKELNEYSECSLMASNKMYEALGKLSHLFHLVPLGEFKTKEMYDAYSLVNKAVKLAMLCGVARGHMNEIKGVTDATEVDDAETGSEGKA